jgi:thiamine biosynthesis protein ThiS
LRIQINGEGREVSDALTVAELINHLQLKPEQVAIELNQRVVRRAQWPSTTVRDGDKIEIVHFVGGG